MRKLVGGGGEENQPPAELNQTFPVMSCYQCRCYMTEPLLDFLLKPNKPHIQRRND